MKKIIHKLEKEVIENSDLLEAEMSQHIKKHKNEYIVFNKKEYCFAGNVAEGVDKGIELFGEDVGFVVRKVTQAIPIFSSMVKI